MTAIFRSKPIKIVRIRILWLSAIPNITKFKLSKKYLWQERQWTRKKDCDISVLSITHLNSVIRWRFLFTWITRSNPPALLIPIMHNVISPVNMRKRWIALVHETALRPPYKHKKMYLFFSILTWCNPSIIICVQRWNFRDKYKQTIVTYWQALQKLAEDI